LFLPWNVHWKYIENYNLYPYVKRHFEIKGNFNIPYVTPSFATLFMKDILTMLVWFYTRWVVKPCNSYFAIWKFVIKLDASIFYFLKVLAFLLFKIIFSFINVVSLQRVNGFYCNKCNFIATNTIFNYFYLNNYIFITS